MSTYVTVLKIQWYLKLAHTYLYWIHKNLYQGYKNLSVAAMKKKLYFAICIKQFRDVVQPQFPFSSSRWGSVQEAAKHMLL